VNVERLWAESLDDLEAQRWVDAVNSIRRYKGRDSDVRAPYKPLLLLWLIGRVAAGEPSEVTFASAEPDLKQLMHKHRMGRNVRVQYPFVYLGTSPELWTVRDSAGHDVAKMPQSRKQSRPFLRDEAIGALSPQFESALRDPQVREAVVNALLHMEFPETLHEELLQEVGLDHLVVTRKARRDPKFKHTVLLAYEERCSFCGFSGRLLGSAVGIEAAHVKMRSHRGPDLIENGLALCVMHHRLFDRGALGLDDELRILVSQHMMLREEESPVPIKELAGAPIRKPQSGYKAPARHFVRWHKKNLFVDPARTAN